MEWVGFPLIDCVMLPVDTPESPAISVCLLSSLSEQQGDYRKGVTLDQLQANQPLTADTQDTILIESTNRSGEHFWWCSLEADFADL